MYKAKSIVDNKFWIVESDEGAKIGTIAVKNNTVNLIIDNKPETFRNMEELMSKHEVSFIKSRGEDETQDTIKNEVYDFPTSTEPHNALWNMQMKLPIYTKTDKSNSYHCAGYYIIRFGTGWVKSFCPKLLTLQRYPHKGPFKTRIEMMEQLRIANESA